MESNRQVVIHMNHKDEPRNSTPGSRAPFDWMKAAESKPRPTVAGFDIGPAGSWLAHFRPPPFPSASSMDGHVGK